MDLSSFKLKSKSKSFYNSQEQIIIKFKGLTNAQLNAHNFHSQIKEKTKKMANITTIIAYDCSGSTSYKEKYHQLSAMIVDNVYKTTPANQVRIVLWDHEARDCTREVLRKMNTRLEGRGGTCPKKVASALLSRKHQNGIRLVIISDGEVDTKEVDDAEREMKNVPRALLRSVEVHLIGRVVNRSVSCVFTRGCPHQVSVYDDSGEIVPEQSSVVTVEDLGLIENLACLQTIADIEEKLPAIERAVNSRVMGTHGDRQLADALIQMRKRVVALMSKEQSMHPVVSRFVAHVRAGEMDQALETCRLVTRAYFKPELIELDLESKVSRLVSAAQGSLRSVFDAQGVRTIKVERAYDAFQEKVEEVTPTDTKGTFPCPLTLEDEADVVLMIASGDGGILCDVDVKIADSCIQCPLNALGYPAVRDAILHRIDNAVSLKSVQESLRHTGSSFLDQSPFTRRPLEGGLVLGQRAEHAKASDWTIARTIHPSAKVLGNLDLWFAVIYFLIESNWKDKFDRLGEEVLDQMRKHLVWRLKNRTSFASLTGLSHVVTTTLPLDVCCWFTLSSGMAMGKDLVPAADPLRGHVFHSGFLQNLCAMADLDLPPGLEEHCARLKVLFHMLSWCKRDDAEFKDAIRALYQNHVVIQVKQVDPVVVLREVYTPKRYVFIDGPVSPADRDLAIESLPSTYQCLPVETIVALSKLVAPRMTSSCIYLPFNGPETKSLPVVKEYWGIDTVPDDLSVPICPTTLRPFTVDPNLKVPWAEAAKKRYKVQDRSKLLSTYKWVEEFVNKYSMYPDNLETFLVFVYNRVIICRDDRTVKGPDTLPISTVEQCEQTLKDYAEYMSNMEVATFKEILVKSRPLDARAHRESLYVGS
jgi:hypothetical protein